MDKEICMQLSEEHLFHVYHRFPVVFESGKGVHLYDTDGKEYLDFASGIGVMAFGYGDAEYEQALTEQIHKLTHTSNLYYHPPLAEAAARLTKVAGLERAFFTNSGAEAMEGAVKTAKKYAFLRDGFAGHEIIAMEHSFHGRTVGALSVTGSSSYREPFFPLMDGVRFAEFNDLKSVSDRINDKTCAIVMETVQGEGGLHAASKEFLEGVRKLCDEHDILLILDEVQCGMGRTGAWYAWQDYGVKPDIMATAKALGAGVPVGAFLVTERVAQKSLVPGDHGSTYGGNPLVCAAVEKSIDIMESRGIIAHVRELTPYLEETLDAFVKRYDFVSERRGKGFMQGLVLDIPVGDVVKKALEEGLVVLSAGGNVLRLLPPLVIERADIDVMAEKLQCVLGGF